MCSSDLLLASLFPLSYLLLLVFFFLVSSRSACRQILRANRQLVRALACPSLSPASLTALATPSHPTACPPRLLLCPHALSEAPPTILPLPRPASCPVPGPASRTPPFHLGFCSSAQLSAGVSCQITPMLPPPAPLAWSSTVWRDVGGETMLFRPPQPAPR